jgi:hypothetical protein
MMGLIILRRADPITGSLRVKGRKPPRRSRGVRLRVSGRVNTYDLTPPVCRGVPHHRGRPGGPPSARACSEDQGQAACQAGRQAAEAGRDGGGTGARVRAATRRDESRGGVVGLADSDWAGM